jgi:hypothetical protein
MGRPSKLTEIQWEKLHKRLLAGEKVKDLAKIFGVSVSLIKYRFSGRIKKEKALAKQIVDVELQFEQLPIYGKLNVLSLADELKAISRNLAGTARNGSITAFRLSSIACNQSSKINFDDPMETQETLQTISALTKMSIEASVVGLALLNANKETRQKDEVINVIRDYGAITDRAGE